VTDAATIRNAGPRDHSRNMDGGKNKVEGELCINEDRFWFIARHKVNALTSRKK
jgi:hypothetical protein